MKLDPTLTAERLRELLDYNPETGVFTWRYARAGRMWPGVRAKTPAGRIYPKGYRQISIDSRKYLAHRLAWLYVYGEWPPLRLDHANRVPDDNRISNLRPLTNGQNLQNQDGPKRNNISGFRGVSRNGHGWSATIKVGGRRHHLGTFDSPEEAHAVYVAAKQQLHPFWTP